MIALLGLLVTVVFGFLLMAVVFTLVLTIGENNAKLSDVRLLYKKNKEVDDKR